MGHDFAVRRLPLARDRGQQRTLEPAAVLVRALEVHVRREGNLARPEGGDAVVHDPGIEPDVHHVVRLVVVGRLVAQQVRGIEVEPRLQPRLLDAQGDLLEQLGRSRVGLARLAVDEQRQRHAPGALPRDAPVRPPLHHAGDALLAPARHPAHLADLLQGGAAQAFLVHAHEPLRRGAEDHGRLVPPAVRVTVHVGLVPEQAATRRERLHDRLVRLEDLLPLEQRRALEEPSIGPHRVVDRQPVAAPDDIVLHAVARRGVDRARARVGRHVVAEDDRHDPVVERVLQPQPLERATARMAQVAHVPQPGSLRQGLEQRRGDHQVLTPAARVGLDEHIVQLGVHADRLVRRQRPGCRGPDHDRGVRRLPCRDAEAPGEIGRVHHREARIDRGRGPLLVFHFRLGQRGTAIQAPVDGLEAPHDVAVADDACEGAQLFRLVLRQHGQVRVVPVAEHAQALEVLALSIDLAGRVVAAGLPEGARVEPLPDAAVLLLHLLLDRQAVAVPARHVGRVVAVQRARLDDDVLEDLVDRVADMDRGVGVRRAIDEHELRPAGRPVPDLPVQVVPLPGLQHRRLAAREVGLHREVRLGQVHRLLVVHVLSRFSRRRGRQPTPSRARAARASSCICVTSASRFSNFDSSRSLDTKSTPRYRP